MIIAVIFENGFSILNTMEQVFTVIQKEKKVEIKGFFSAEAAYVYSCGQYVRRWLACGNKTQVPLPQLGELLKAGGTYLNPLAECLIYPIIHGDSNGQPIRFFSFVAPFICACVCGVYNVMAVILEKNVQYFHVCEFQLLNEAQEQAIYQYKVQQFSISAYLKTTIYLPNELSVNEVFQDIEANSISQQIKEIKDFIN